MPYELRGIDKKNALPPEADLRIGLNGPDLRLGPKPALALTMVFHELAANALRYGALARQGEAGDEGPVEVGTGGDPGVVAAEQPRDDREAQLVDQILREQLPQQRRSPFAQHDVVASVGQRLQRRHGLDPVGTGDDHARDACDAQAPDLPREHHLRRARPRPLRRPRERVPRILRDRQDPPARAVPGAAPPQRFPPPHGHGGP